MRYEELLPIKESVEASGDTITGRNCLHVLRNTMRQGPLRIPHAMRGGLGRLHLRRPKNGVGERRIVQRRTYSQIQAYLGAYNVRRAAIDERNEY